MTPIGPNLDSAVKAAHDSGILYEEFIREVRRRFIITVLADNRGNQCRAARELGMHRNTLSRQIAELQVEVAPLKKPARRVHGNARTARTT